MFGLRRREAVHRDHLGELKEAREERDKLIRRASGAIEAAVEKVDRVHNRIIDQYAQAEELRLARRSR